MKPAPFDYVRADSADDAVRLLAQHGDDARILAGGQSLMAVLNMRLAQPSLLIDISRSASLGAVTAAADGLRIGAAATQSAIEWRRALADEVPLLKLAFPYISHFQIRNKGTVCGSIAHADPSAELPLCLLALRGDVVLRSAKASRTVAADALFTGMLSTARRGDELLESVRFPKPRDDERFGFTEFSIRHGDYAVCAAAAVVTPRAIRLTIGGIGDRPIARDWDALDGAALDDALNQFAWSLDPQDDPHISATARRHFVRRLGRNAIDQARGRVLPGTVSTQGPTS